MRTKIALLLTLLTLLTALAPNAAQARRKVHYLNDDYVIEHTEEMSQANTDALLQKVLTDPAASEAVQNQLRQIDARRKELTAQRMVLRKQAMGLSQVIRAYQRQRKTDGGQIQLLQYKLNVLSNQP